MRVDVERRGREWRYRLRLDGDDVREAQRGFSDRPDPLWLAEREYRVVLPLPPGDLHPDLHALAVWYTLRPFIGSRLLLPFAVSAETARWLQESRGLDLPRVDDRLKPRRPPRRASPALLFSGGMDSMAASLLLPEDTRHLFLDRIGCRRVGQHEDRLIDLAGQRAACAAVAAEGRPVLAVGDSHEGLFFPYPTWHSDMAVLPALYLADALELGVVDSGEVLDSKLFGGYHAGGASGWRMRPRSSGAGAAGGDDFLSLVGLQRAHSIGGLSEVATTALVGRSRFREKSFSCYYPAEGQFCLRCDKCFKKLLLRHVSDGREVPADLFEHFLSYPYLAAIFERPYLDWHHVWYYLFQNIRCRHWFAMELARQARQGPDLSWLARWYPGAEGQMAPAYREEVRERIVEQVGAMSEAQMEALADLDVPPLHAPVERVKILAGRKVAACRPAVATWSPETKALYRLLRKKLPPGENWRLEPYRLEEIYLRAGQDCVCLGWSAAPGASAAFAADTLVVRLFRRREGQNASQAHLGSLGLAVEPAAPHHAAWLQALVGKLREVFAQAKREIDA